MCEDVAKGKPRARMSCHLDFLTGGVRDVHGGCGLNSVKIFLRCYLDSVKNLPSAPSVWWSPVTNNIELERQYRYSDSQN